MRHQVEARQRAGLGVNVFISYASEYRPIAEKLAVGLVQDGHETFFDRDTLPAGEAFHTQIREAIAAADLVVFLVSPESIESASYALTELNLVKERWPNPSQRVLPVLVRKTPYEAIPAYLGAVTIFEPRGNVVADVLAEIAKVDRGRKRRRVLVIGSAAVAAIAVAVAAVAMRPRPGPQLCYLTAELRSTEGGHATLQGMTIDVSHAGATNSFIVSDDGTAAIDVGPLTPPDTGWTLHVNGPDGAMLGSQEIQGCASSSQENRLDGGLELIIRPR